MRARKGDTIARIAAARNLDVNDVARLNGIPVDAELRAGQEIKVHVNGRRTVRPAVKFTLIRLTIRVQARF